MPVLLGWYQQHGKLLVMSCSAASCTNDSMIAWERWMTTEEVDQYHTSGDLPLHETSGKLMVYACGEHQLNPPEQMTTAHDAICTAPPTCNCSVSD